jgi:hypothetical protein
MKRLLVALVMAMAVMLGGLGIAPTVSAHVVSPGGSICEASDDEPGGFGHYLIVHAHPYGSNWACYSWNRLSGDDRRECYWIANGGGIVGGYSCGHNVW